MMKSVILLIIIVQFHLSYCQNNVYEKGIEIALATIIKENPRDRYYVNSNVIIYNTGTGLFEAFFECNYNFESVKQSKEVGQNIIIPKSYKKYFKKNSFFTRLLHGKRLKRITVTRWV